MTTINVEEIQKKLIGSCQNDSVEDPEGGLSEEQVEEWLDNHEDFVHSYFTRKAHKLISDSHVRQTRVRSSASPHSSLSGGAAGSGAVVTSPGGVERNPSPLAGSAISGTSTPTRKISSSDFDKGGYLKPMISLVDGIPSFLSSESMSISRPTRQRRSNEELKRLKIDNEQSLLLELVHDIANDLDITSLCHKILQNVSILTDGDRCSLFLVQKFTHGHRILVSKVHDVNSSSTVADVSASEEIVVPWGSGIVGYVAQTG